MKLKKGISFLGVFSIASGAMISSGIFILPSLAFSRVGPAIFISYFLAGLLGMIGIMSIIELSTAMPKAGGDYFFINKTLGPLLGTISGFLGWFALSLKSAFAIFGITEIIKIYSGMSPVISGLLLCIFFVYINLIGVKISATFQIIMVIGLVAIMILFIITGLPEINLKNYSPLMSAGFKSILITSGFIFISFGGLLKVANVSEEILNPKKNIPLGMLSSIISVTILYTLITFILVGTMKPELFSASLTPVADSARATMGNIGYLLITIASFLAFFTTANAGVMAASRYPMALACDDLLPKSIASVSKRYKTPIISIIITGVFIFIALLFPLEVLVKAASTVILTSYVLTNLSVIILRESRITNYQPSFKAPFYPWLQIFCIIIFSFFVIILGAASIELSLSFLLIGIIVYLFFGRKISMREFALMHLLKRITDSLLIKNVLEDELREILVNRDNIEQDNFDNLIKKARIYEIEESAGYEEVIALVAQDIAQEYDLDKDSMIQRFHERQEESNMAISHFFAIPHIIIDGENKMFLAIVRSKKGVKFTDNENSVKAIFVLGGTRDKRVLHLKTIASIATLIGSPDFQQNWQNTNDKIELKNLMILNSRKRFH